MRLFCAIEIPEGIQARLATLTAALKPFAKLSWSPIENLHVTTKFMGEWPEAKLDEMKRALQNVPRPGPIQIAIQGLDWFPNERNPRVLFAGIAAEAGLARLARDTDHATGDLGIEPEKREFRPHLTLARRRNPVPIDRLRQAVAAESGADFGEFQAAAFFLYLSNSGRYTKLAEFPLA